MRETHRFNSVLRQFGIGWLAPLAPILIALLLATLTAAGAIAETKRIHAIGYGFQTPGYMENLGLPGLRQMVW